MPVLVCVAVSSAEAERELGAALKGGVSAATLAEDYRESRYGFSGGVGGHFQRPLPGRFSMGGQLELLYTPRGARAIMEGVYLGRVRQHYLDFTFAARPGARLGPTTMYLLLGGGLNLLLSADKEFSSGTKEDITGGLRRIDVALLAGVGIALPLSRHELGPFQLDAVFLEARHDHGLVDTDTVNGGYQNRTSSLMLGLSFALGTEPAARTAAAPAASGDPLAR